MNTKSIRDMAEVITNLEQTILNHTPTQKKQTMVKQMPINEYKRLYYHSHKPAFSKTELKKMNKVGIATLFFLKEKKYSYTRIGCVIPRSPCHLSSQYKATLLTNPDYLNSEEYQFYKQYIDKNIPMFGPINIEEYQDHPNTHDVLHIMETSS